MCYLGVNTYLLQMQGHLHDNHSKLRYFQALVDTALERHLGAT